MKQQNNTPDSLQDFLQATGKKININALADAAGINREQMHQYTIGYRKASTRTRERIQAAVDSLAMELAKAKF